MRSSAIGWASIALLAVVVTTSCSGPSRKTSASTTAPKVEPTTVDPVGQDVVAAYRRYWDVYIAVGSEMRLPDPRLAEVATGEALRSLQSGFAASKVMGEVLRGSIDVAPKITAIDPEKATIEDCYDGHILGYDARTGEAKGPDGPGRTLVTVTMVRETGTWKVAGIRHEGDGCTPGS